MPDDFKIDIRRVAWRFYTWRLEFCGDIRVGIAKSKRAAFMAAHQFIAQKRGARRV